MSRLGDAVGRGRGRGVWCDIGFQSDLRLVASATQKGPDERFLLVDTTRLALQVKFCRRCGEDLGCGIQE